MIVAFEVLPQNPVEATAFARDTDFAQQWDANDRQGDRALEIYRDTALALEIAEAHDGKASQGINSCLRGEANTKAMPSRIALQPIRRYRRA